MSEENNDEIRAWRDERKRNYPTRLNIQRKREIFEGKLAREDLIDEDARKRLRQVNFEDTQSICTMEDAESRKEQNIDISKFLNLENSSYTMNCCNVTVLQMLMEGLHADITINANGGSVKAHKSVLVSVSPVFEAMFDMHNIQEEQLTSIVDLPDISIQGLRLFLVLIYILKKDNIVAPLEFETSINKHFDELVEACCKYQVMKLWPTITANLKFHLTPKNCWDYLHRSTFMGVNVVFKCRKYMFEHYKEVIESESFILEMQTNPALVQAFLMSKLLRTTFSFDGYVFFRK